MRSLALTMVLVLSGAWLAATAFAQTFATTPAKSSDASQLEALTKKIDEQNAKIDILSQEIIKLEQQISHARPGIMIGEGAPPISATATSTSSPATESPRPTLNGNSHTVSRGETLTSIARLYKVSVEELQKFNHIEDGRKLQAGQTIMIPPSPTPTPAASASTND